MTRKRPERLQTASGLSIVKVAVCILPFWSTPWNRCSDRACVAGILAHANVTPWSDPDFYFGAEIDIRSRFFLSTRILAIFYPPLK